MILKKILAIGDLHCGSLVGITPPSWFINPKRNKSIASLQREMWDNYLEMLKEVGHVDILIVNGDVIDGKGHKSGGSELLTSDLIEQCEIACEVIKEIDFEKVYFTYGTPYHVSSSGEDFEKLVSDKVGGTIYDQLLLDVEGVQIDVKHKVGSSSVPNGRFSPVARQRLWDVLSSARDERASSTVFLRSHVHYFTHCGESDWIGFTLPALQAPGTKFGARQCTGTVDWGMVSFTVDNGRVTSWESKIENLDSFKPEIVKVY